MYVYVYDYDYDYLIFLNDLKLRSINIFFESKFISKVFNLNNNYYLSLFFYIIL